MKTAEPFPQLDLPEEIRSMTDYNKYNKARNEMLKWVADNSDKATYREIDRAIRMLRLITVMLRNYELHHLDIKT